MTIQNIYKAEFKLFSNENTNALLDINEGHVYKIDEAIKNILSRIKNDSIDLNSIDSIDKSEVFEIIEELKTINIISDKKFDKINRSSKLEKKDSVIRSIDLLISQDCNMSCRYCFADDGTYHRNKELMSWETAKKAVDFLIANSGSEVNLHIIFFGGEPLMNVPVIKKVIEYSEKMSDRHQKKFSFSMSTNGTLLTKELISYFRKNNVNIQISIDGNSDSQNYNRPMQKGQGSYELVTRNSNSLIKSQKNVVGRLTVSKATLNQIYSNTLHLLELGFSSVHIEHASGDSKYNKEVIDNAEEFRSMFKELEKLVYRNSKTLSELKGINNVDKIIRLIHNRTQRNFACSAGRGYLCIDISGDIYLCHRLTGNEKYKFGNINENILNTYSINTIQKKANVLNKTSCKKCWARYICGGDCMAIAVDINNDISIPDKHKCVYNKLLIEMAILVYASFNKNQLKKLTRKNKSSQNNIL